MIDIKLIRENVEEVIQRLNTRGGDYSYLRDVKAMDEQNEGSKQIFDALYTMNNNTSEVCEASKQMTEGNKLILNQIKNLQEITEQMQSCMSLITTGTSKISELGNELDNVTPQLMNSIDEISNQIDEFNV